MRPGMWVSEAARKSAQRAAEMEEEAFNKIKKELPVRVAEAANRGERELFIMELDPTKSFYRRWYQLFMLDRSRRNLKDGVAKRVFDYLVFHGMNPEIRYWEWGVASESCAIFISW